MVQILYYFIIGSAQFIINTLYNTHTIAFEHPVPCRCPLPRAQLIYDRRCTHLSGKLLMCIQFSYDASFDSDFKIVYFSEDAQIVQAQSC